MAGARQYDDPCGVARALDLVGERWTLLVVRELLFGPKRFSDLVRGLPGMSQNVLSQRLRELAAAGLVTDAATLRSVVFGDRPLADAVAAGDAEVRGDAQAAGRFVSRFPRPAPVGSGGSGKPHSGPAKP